MALPVRPQLTDWLADYRWVKAPYLGPGSGLRVVVASPPGALTDPTSRPLGPRSHKKLQNSAQKVHLAASARANLPKSAESTCALAQGCLADSQQRGTREFELETERWNKQKPALDLDFAPQVGFLTSRATALPRARVGPRREARRPRVGPSREARGEPEGGPNPPRGGGSY